MSPGASIIWQCIPVIVRKVLHHKVEVFEKIYYCQKCAFEEQTVIDLHMLQNDPKKFIRDVLHQDKFSLYINHCKTSIRGRNRTRGGFNEGRGGGDGNQKIRSTTTHNKNFKALQSVT